MTSLNTITTKHLEEFVQGCQEFYYWNDMSPSTSRFEMAHHPLPRGMGEDVVPLSWEHHQIHGLLQSEAVGRICFYSGHAKKFLRSPVAKSLPDYFYEDLWKLYWKWSRRAYGNTVSERSQRMKDYHSTKILDQRTGTLKKVNKRNRLMEAGTIAKSRTLRSDVVFELALKVVRESGFRSDSEAIYASVYGLANGIYGTDDFPTIAT